MQEVKEPGGVGLLLVDVFPVGHGVDLVSVDEHSVDGALDVEGIVGEDADEGGEDETRGAVDGGHGRWDVEVGVATIVGREPPNAMTCSCSRLHCWIWR